MYGTPVWFPGFLKPFFAESKPRARRGKFFGAAVSRSHNRSKYPNPQTPTDTYKRSIAPHLWGCACEITMQGNATKLRLAAYAQNVCDMRTLALAKRQHNRHRRAQKQHAKYTERVFDLTKANKTRGTYIVHRTMKRKQHMHRGKVTLLLSSARISMIEYGNMTQIRASLEDDRYKYRVCLCNLARDPSLAWLAGAGTIASGSTGRHSGTSGWCRNYAGFQVIYRGGWWSSGGYLIYSSCMPRVVCKVRMGFPSGDCCGPLEY